MQRHRKGAGRVTPPERLLRVAGLGHLWRSVTHMLHPGNAELSADKRHYLNEKGVWTAAHSSLVGTIDADGIYTPPSHLEFNDDWATKGVAAQAWIGASASRAYNLPLTRNSDIVEVAGRTAFSEGAMWATGTNAVGRQFLTRYFTDRIRQDGTLTKFKWYSAATANFLTITVQVWRKNGATYDLVGQSAVTGWANGYNSLTLTTPITGCQRGDVLCLLFTTAGACSIDGRAASANFDASSWTATNTVLTTPADFEAGGNQGQEVFCYRGFMQAPMIVGIGDSIMGKLDGFLYGDPTDLTGGILPKLAAIDSRFVYQNMGIGSQTTTHIEARFAADVVALKPRYALIQGGANDIALGGSEATYIAKITSMLDQCVAASIIPVVMTITPWGTSGATHEQMQATDTWAASLRTLLNASYPTAILVDCANAIGQFHTGGDAGNLWDLQAAYDSGDHIHPNAAGNAVIAECIYNAIFAYVKPVVANKAIFLFDRKLTAAEITALETLHTKL
jgi:lysophospholipase L1-like esterase